MEGIVGVDLKINLESYISNFNQVNPAYNVNSRSRKHMAICDNWDPEYVCRLLWHARIYNIHAWEAQTTGKIYRKQHGNTYLLIHKYSKSTIEKVTFCSGQPCSYWCPGALAPGHQ